MLINSFCDATPGINTLPRSMEEEASRCSHQMVERAWGVPDW